MSNSVKSVLLLATLTGILGFVKRDFFDAEPEAETVPNVDLSLS